MHPELFCVFNFVENPSGLPLTTTGREHRNVDS
jgi:hypothetical protein